MQKCKLCGKEMFLDRVTKRGKRKVYYYTCNNPNCNNFTKAFTENGDEAEAMIREQA